jgi:hypothetical protein
MKPTKIWSLVSYLISAAIFGGVLAKTLTMRGFAVPVSPLNLAITLGGIGLALGLLAIPMARYRASLKNSSKRTKRIGALYAYRVLVFAKSGSIVGSLFLGWHLGVLVIQLSAPAVAGNIVYTVLGIAGSTICAVVAVVVEYLFRIPPDAPPPAEGTPA